MAEWLSVFCARSVCGITDKDIHAALDHFDVDMHLIAEGFGIEDDELVDEALSLLRIQPAKGRPDAKFEVHYRPPGSRPIFVHLISKPRLVRERVQESLQRLEKPRSRGAKRVRAHLAAVLEVVDLELGATHFNDMGIVLAGQIAEYLATEGAGLIVDQNNDWWAVEDRVPVLLVGPPLRG